MRQTSFGILIHTFVHENVHFRLSITFAKLLVAERYTTTPGAGPVGQWGTSSKSVAYSLAQLPIEPKLEPSGQTHDIAPEFRTQVGMTYSYISTHAVTPV